ncbi:MAG TPA: hypothetical protein VNE63_04040 [Candidatus Acidoferrales bacterium]|nr:hypothetical protein [Candidatus Acidoferrales bacterium]
MVHRFTHGITLQGMYTYSKSLDNASSIGGSAPVVVQQDGNYAAERGLSSFDMRHQFRLFSVYELPFGERSRWANHGWKEHALGNWRLLNIVTWHTGTPLTALLGGSAANNSGTGSNFSERADRLPTRPSGLAAARLWAFSTELLSWRLLQASTAMNIAARLKGRANSIGISLSPNLSGLVRNSGTR